MKQAQLKMLFDSGAVKNPVITHAVMSEKWQMMFDVVEKKEGSKAVTTTVVLESKRGNTREFSTVEAAIKLLKEMGFATVSVKFQ